MTLGETSPFSVPKRVLHTSGGYWYLCGGSLIQAAPAFAADTAPATVGAGTLLQVVLGLALVLAMIFAAAWAMRRFHPNAGANGVLRIVGGTAVGNRERVLLLEVDQTWLVVGVAPGQVTSLCTLAKPEHLPQPAVPPSPTGFQAWLKKAMEQRA